MILATSAVVWRGDKVLVVRRGRPPRKDYWSLPGGKIEAGETAQAAASREVMEETGVATEIIGHIGVFRISGYEISCFYAKALTSEIGSGDDAADAKWLGLEELQLLQLAPHTLDAIIQSQKFIKA